VRVCHGVSGLDYSFQKTLAYNIMNYANIGMGPLLCALCGFMWFVKVRLISHPPPNGWRSEQS
jgi:hypothetical protein